MLEKLNQEELCRQFCTDVKLHKRSNSMVMLETPFTFPDGDNYALYLENTRTGGIRVSDGGSTLIQLSYENDTDKLFEGARATLFDQVVGEQGVSFDNESGQLFVETSIQDLSKAAFRVGQAMTRIYDLTFLNRSRVASTFYDDLKEQICNILPKENVKSNYVVPGLPSGDHYPVDFCFDGKSGVPVFLFGIPNRDKARLATICLQHFLQHRIDFDSVLVFQNQEEIPRNDLSRLSNVGGDQISSLNATDDFRRKILKKVA